MATHADGLVISATSDQEPPKEIDLTADQLTFERQTIEECKKKRIQTLNQIEIKMVDKAADKKISEFMYQGMDHTDSEIEDPLEQAFNQNMQTEATDSAASSLDKTNNREKGRLRQMSKQVKSMLSEAKQALHLDSDEDYDTMTINEEVQVIEHAPAVFHAIKQMDNITPQMIETSLSTDANAKQLFKAKESAGKSGSFMFSSADKRFLIKTMNKSEQAVLVKALPKYLDHLCKNPKSLIAKIYGIYTVKMEDIGEVHILLMGNLFLNVKEKLSEFDLKGSIINREVHSPFTMKDCLKDVNLVKYTVSINQPPQEVCFQSNHLALVLTNIFFLLKSQAQDCAHGNFIKYTETLKFLRFQRDDMRSICQRIYQDIEFMAEHNLMDYSLLLITEKNPDYEVWKE